MALESGSSLSLPKFGSDILGPLEPSEREVVLSESEKTSSDGDAAAPLREVACEQAAENVANAAPRDNEQNSPEADCDASDATERGDDGQAAVCEEPQPTRSPCPASRQPQQEETADAAAGRSEGDQRRGEAAEDQKVECPDAQEHLEGLSSVMKLFVAGWFPRELYHELHDNATARNIKVNKSLQKKFEHFIRKFLSSGPHQSWNFNLRDNLAQIRQVRMENSSEYMMLADEEVDACFWRWAHCCVLLPEEKSMPEEEQLQHLNYYVSREFGGGTMFLRAVVKRGLVDFAGIAEATPCPAARCEALMKAFVTYIGQLDEDVKDEKLKAEKKKLEKRQQKRSVRTNDGEATERAHNSARPQEGGRKLRRSNRYTPKETYYDL